jgi:hypothetical protein
MGFSGIQIFSSFLLAILLLFQVVKKFQTLGLLASFRNFNANPYITSHMSKQLEEKHWNSYHSNMSFHIPIYSVENSITKFHATSRSINAELHEKNCSEATNRRRIWIGIAQIIWIFEDLRIGLRIAPQFDFSKIISSTKVTQLQIQLRIDADYVSLV